MLSLCGDQRELKSHHIPLYLKISTFPCLSSSYCVLCRLFRRFWGPTNSFAVNWGSTTCRSPGLSGRCSRTTMGLWTESLASHLSSNRRATRFPQTTCWSWWPSTGGKAPVEKVTCWRLLPGFQISNNMLFLSLCVCRAEKTSKLQTIPGTVDIAVDYVPMEHPSMFNTPYPCSHSTLCGSQTDRERFLGLLDR